MNTTRLVLIALTVLAILSAIVWGMGSRNCVTPAGYVGYVTKDSIFGKTAFVGLQTGPTSTGRGWLLQCQNISVTPYTYDEEFSDNGDGNSNATVLSKDRLQISFNVHIIWNIRPDKVQQYMEQYSTIGADTSPDKAVKTGYDNFIKERLRTAARAEVSKYEAMELNDDIATAGTNIQKQIQDMTKDTPFNVTSVVVGNIQFPKQVTDAVAAKLAAGQDLLTRDIQIAITNKDATRRIAEADGIAKAMALIQTKLTPLYIQHEAIEAQKTMVDSPNHTMIYIPVGANGVPLVNAVGDDSGGIPEPAHK